MRLNKTFFSRNRHRETAFGNMFKKASASLNFFMQTAIAIATPAVITTSLLSEALILVLINILLCAGYLSNFFYRLWKKEISISELIISVIGIATAFAFSFFFFPVTLSFSLTSVLFFMNYTATVINGFFLVRNLIVPPLKKLIEHMAQWMGFHIGGSYFYQAPLTVEMDRMVVDRLFRKHYGFDVVHSQSGEEKLRPFNTMLRTLCAYVDKYTEVPFGSIRNASRISTTEKMIGQLTIEGDSTSCVDFVKKKIDFKTSKMQKLKDAQQDLNSVTSKHSVGTVLNICRFFNSFNKDRVKGDRVRLIHEAQDCLQKEIDRQQSKLDNLKACLPENIHSEASVKCFQ